MEPTISWRPSPALVISCLSLFVALSGSAYAVSRGEIKQRHIANGAVDGPQIAKRAVSGPKIARGAVGSGKIPRGAIVRGKIRAGAVGTDQIADGSVTEQKLAFEPGQLVGPQGPEGPEGPEGPQGPADGPAGGDLTGNYPNPLIADGAVVASKIGSLIVREDGITIDAGESEFHSVPCAPGEVLLSGGPTWETPPGDELIRLTRPDFDTNSWGARGLNLNPDPKGFFIRVLCLQT